MAGQTGGFTGWNLLLLVAWIVLMPRMSDIAARVRSWIRSWR
ncbi:MAG: hypothetical protein R6V19_12340 [Armatimonadota bacterium]